MKKIFTLLFFSMALNLASNAQDNKPADNTEAQKARREKIAQTIEALKVAYITKKLNLTADEAKQFWPAYNGFSEEIKKAKIEHKDDDIAFEEKRVGIMKKYKESFKKALNNDEDRVKNCFRAGGDFQKMVKEEWKNRMGERRERMQGHGEGRPPRGGGEREQGGPRGERRERPNRGGGNAGGGNVGN